MDNNRHTMNLGRKALLQSEVKKIAILIDNAAKALTIHFDPMDRDRKYVESIDTDLVTINCQIICDNKPRLDALLRELSDVNRELGVTA
jgi:hypothetical protein